MAQEQIVTGRIVQKYTVGTYLHRAVANVRNLQLVGASYMINSRTLDENDLYAEQAANGFREALSYLAPSTTTWSDAELWEKVSGSWVMRATFTLTSTDHKSGDAILASQLTYTLRDKLFHFLKVVFLESSETGIPRKYTAYSAMPGTVQLFAKQFLSTYTVTYPPYNWQVSDSAQFINTSPLVGLVTTFNRKIRRGRGLA